MNQDESRFLDEIKMEFENFELPYEAGRWEEFKKHAGEKIPVVPPSGGALRKLMVRFSAAAAVIAYLFFVLHDISPVRPKDDQQFNSARGTAGTSAAPSPDGAPLPLSPHQPARSMLAKQATKIPESRRYTEAHKIEEADNFQPLPALQIHTDDRTQSPTMVHELALPTHHLSAIFPRPGKEKAEPVAQPVSFAAIEIPENVSRHTDRWRFGASLGSSFTEERMNIEAGFISQFKVTENIRLSGGLAYNKISGNYHLDPVQSVGGTTVMSKTGELQLLELPLSVQYRPLKGWFASAGVSLTTTLQENEILGKKMEVLKESSVADPQTGELVTLFVVETKQYTEKIPGTEFTGQNGLSFINLSIGREQPFGKKNSLLVEPFVKIPVDAFATKEIDLRQAGLRVKVLF